MSWTGKEDTSKNKAWRIISDKSSTDLTSFTRIAVLMRNHYGRTYYLPDKSLPTTRSLRWENILIDQEGSVRLSDMWVLKEPIHRFHSKADATIEELFFANI